MPAEQSIRVTQRKSAAGANPRQRDTLRSLRLGRIGRSAEHRDGPVLRGMVKTVAHLVSTSDQGGSDSRKGRGKG